MWALLTLTLVALNLLDYQLTMLLMRIGGIEIEANPLARWMYENGGSMGMLLLKLVMVLATVRIVHILKSRRRATALALLCGACVFMLSVVAYNFWLVMTCREMGA
jgi:hypothetical protein